MPSSAHVSPSETAARAAAPPVTPDRTAVGILAAVSVSHLLNDTIQSLLPAIYPLLKAAFALSFSQIGLMTLALMLTRIAAAAGRRDI